MIPLGPFSGQTQICFAFFATFALAALQNVTVDDAVLTGAVVPQYLPNNSEWNIGNTCTTCYVQPNPSLVYNGTWHDATFSTGNGFTQEVQFTFTGSALYIFFIMANYVQYTTTLTNITFWLDGVVDSTYTHNPSSSTDYDYNVSVYANEAMAFGEHNMTIQPLNSTTNVLMLFDYLIYTTNASTSASSSASSSASAIPTSSPSVTPSVTQAASSGPNIGAIVGGAVGGLVALILVIASLLYYRRRKRDGPAAEEGSVEPFVVSGEMAPAPLADTMSPTRQPFATFALAGSKTGPSVSTPPSSIPPSSTVASSSSGALSSNQPGLLEQVGMLRDEVARLRQLHDTEQNMFELGSEAPPEYS